MSSVMTYASLQQDLIRYLERHDDALTAQAPRLIALAEFRCAREVKQLGTIRYVVGAFTDGVPVIQKPALWLETLTFNVAEALGSTQRATIIERTYDYVRTVYPNPSTDVGRPVHYADYGFNNWIVGPTPDAAYAFEVGYYERPNPLSDSNQTNWFTQNAPDLLLYATLLECAPYFKTDERIQVWQSRYEGAAQALRGEDASRALDAQTIGGRR